MSFTSTCKVSVFLLFTLISLCTRAQKEGNIWYFGRKAGISFNTVPPTLLYDGNIQTREGCATLCNGEGQLQFYTDGVQVWNRFHTVMPNGTGLKGNAQSTQSGLIVPWPGENIRFFLFTVDAIESSPQTGLNYSVVDLSLDNGRGDVTAKNVNLFSPGTEKLAAVKHGNGRDYWVVSHPWNSDTLYSYLINCLGIASVPVKTKIGFTHSGSLPRASGQMKLSANGKYMALAICDVNNNAVEVFKFDNISGVFSDLKRLNYGGLSQPYGIEFSSNTQFLYVADMARKKIDQYEVGNYANLAASKTEIATLTNTPGSLQLAPNGKIYVAQSNASYLSVIDRPNERGLSSSFQNNAVYLDDRKSELGLPGFVQSYFMSDLVGVSDFTFHIHCDSVHFFPLHREPGMNWDWDFGDGNNAADSVPVHFYSDTGLFLVRLITLNSAMNCSPLKTDTSFETVHVTQPRLSLAADRMACDAGYTGILESNFNAESYLWSTGETSKSIAVQPNTVTYWLQTEKEGCFLRDTVNVFGQFGNNSIFTRDTILLCEGDSVLLNDADSVNALFVWSTGANTVSIWAIQSGLYWLEQHSGSCRYADTLQIEQQLRPNLSYTGDTVYCRNDNSRLDMSGAKQYKWIPMGDLSTDTGAHQAFIATTSLVYTIRGGDSSCYSDISISLKVQEPPDDFVVEGDFCFVKGMKLTGPEGDWNFIWSTGETSRAITPPDSGRYDLTLTNGCGQVSDSIYLFLSKRSDCALYIPNAFRPGSDINPAFPFISGTEYNILSVSHCNVTYYKLLVFNRWGEVVFQSDRLENTWDGRLKDGSSAESGIYGYAIEAKYVSTCGDYDGMLESFRGSLTLLR